MIKKNPKFSQCFVKTKFFSQLISQLIKFSQLIS
jgi:hypothetical protein